MNPCGSPSHVAGFSDPLVDDNVSKNRYGDEYLFLSPVVIDGKTGDSIFALESEKTNEELQAAAEPYIHKKTVVGTLAADQSKDFT